MDLTIICGMEIVRLPIQQSSPLFQNVVGSSEEKSVLQLFLPHRRPCAHSLSLLQSPSPSRHGPYSLQHRLILLLSVPSQAAGSGGGFSGTKIIVYVSLLYCFQSLEINNYNKLEITNT